MNHRDSAPPKSKKDNMPSKKDIFLYTTIEPPKKEKRNPRWYKDSHIGEEIPQYELDRRKKISEAVRKSCDSRTWKRKSKKKKQKNKYPELFNQQLKDKIRVRDNFICQLCGVPELECDKRLSVHHIDCDKNNCDINNLISLCSKCHGKAKGYKIKVESTFSQIAIANSLFPDSNQLNLSKYTTG